ncbi:MAG TPA: DUF87 domain-containing protein, partial [Tepidisphaeraceae bacterium]|nr:DUF87 domain-containing protein [Tepidisphaeraceae bacterium]
MLRAEGFVPIGQFDYRLSLSVWWHPAADRRLQVIVLRVGRSALIRGDKSYYLVSVTPDGETWARDIGLLHDWLESHFPEVRISLSHFRDVPPELAKAEVARRMAADAPTQPLPSVEQVAALQRQLESTRDGIRSSEALLSLSDVDSDLLTGYMRSQARAGKAQVEQLKPRVDRERERLGVLQHLQREYQRKGSAAVYTFGIGSNAQCAPDPTRFRDALRAVVHELTDLHRYQVRQKLEGGRLNVRIAEATEPAMTWVEQWLGGALTPNQLNRLGPEFNALRQLADGHVMVTPDEPITVDGGHVRHSEKHVAARFVSDVLARTDKRETGAHDGAAVLTPETIPADAFPLTLGQRVDDAGRSIGPVAFPLAQMVHIYISGSTGSGKSYLARVLLEEAAKHERLNVLVLDPRNQSVGLLVPEDRPKVLERYAEFGMNLRQARGLS